MSLTAPGTLIDATSEAVFNKCLADHPGGLVVAHFYADWAPQCAHMNEVLLELAAQLPYVTCVKVAAEEVEDLLEKYEVTAVPSFIFFKNQQKIDRLDGANAPELTAKVRKHAEGVTVAIPTTAPKEDVNTRIKRLLQQTKCVLFMKGTAETPRCGFSRQIVELLNNHQADYSTFDILNDEEVRQGLKVYSNWPTYPQLYINGELVGGLDIVREMAANGELEDLLPKKLDLAQRLTQLINKAPVVLFMKGSPSEPKCGFSRQIISILEGEGVIEGEGFQTFDILTDNEVREGLKKHSNWPTYPQLYVKGELVGGLDIVREMKESGDLAEALKL